MKHLCTLLPILITLTVSAQHHSFKFGLKGGLSYFHLENYGGGFYSDFDPKPGWTAGILFEYKRGGFVNYSIAPELNYTVSNTEADLLYITDRKAQIQSIDLPVTGKLGLQLSKIFRPYLLGNVYGSYVVDYNGSFFEDFEIDKKDPELAMNRWYFGMSAGMGFDLWRFQVEGRYRWNLNCIKNDELDALRQMGFELSLTFFIITRRATGNALEAKRTGQ